MARRRWLWRRKPSRKSPGGTTDTSGSPPSSLSEKHSSEQEVVKRSSPGRPRPPEAPSSTSSDDRQTIKDLTSKLSAALASVRAKEDLANQHNKVAEEAVSGWERAETQLASVKKQLEDTTQKNTSLEERIHQLSGALKECIRKLGQTRAEQENKLHDVLAEKNGEWEKERSALGSQLVELQHQLEATDRKAKSMNFELRRKLEAVEKEKADLKLRLLDQTKQLRVRTRDMELSTVAAEAASKQHLESIKKVAKVEAECRRLQAIIRKASRHDEQGIPTTISASQSNNNAGKQMASLDDGTSRPEVSSSPLVSKLDNGRSEHINADKSMMDDFLEMEKLAASHEASHRSSITEGSQLKSKCQLELQGKDEMKMEDGLLRKTKDVVRKATYSIEKLKVKQEKERAAVAGKFERCQQTIESLSLQLRSLATLEHFVLEDEKLQSDGSTPEADGEMNLGTCLQSSVDLTSSPSALSPSPGPENLSNM